MRVRMARCRWPMLLLLVELLLLLQIVLPLSFMMTFTVNVHLLLLIEPLPMVQLPSISLFTAPLLPLLLAIPRLLTILHLSKLFPLPLPHMPIPLLPLQLRSQPLILLVHRVHTPVPIMSFRIGHIGTHTHSGT